MGARGVQLEGTRKVATTDNRRQFLIFEWQENQSEQQREVAQCDEQLCKTLHDSRCEAGQRAGACRQDGRRAAKPGNRRQTTDIDVDWQLIDGGTKSNVKALPAAGRSVVGGVR